MAGNTNVSLPQYIRVRNSDGLITRGLYVERIVMPGYSISAMTSKNTNNSRKTLVIANCTDPQDALASSKWVDWGGAGVPIGGGMPILPGQMTSFEFSPDAWVDVYINAPVGVVVAIGEVL